MANWQLFITGAALTVEIQEGDGLPNIPGYLSNDMKVTGVLPSNHNFTTYLNKYWSGQYQNKLYSSLPKIRGVTRQTAYSFNGSYNSGMNPSDITWTLTAVAKSNNCKNYYVGSNVYFIDRASHRGSYYQRNTGDISVTFTYTDGTTEVKKFNNVYAATTDRFNGNKLADHAHIKGLAPKNISKIVVVGTYINQGAQWHDSGNRDYYKKWIIEKGFNTFPESIKSHYHLENVINFAATSGYYLYKIEDPTFD